MLSLSFAEFQNLACCTNDKKEQVTHSNTNPGLASTLRMRTAISPWQWQPWTAVSALLGLISMAKALGRNWTNSRI